MTSPEPPTLWSYRSSVIAVVTVVAVMFAVCVWAVIDASFR